MSRAGEGTGRIAPAPRDREGAAPDGPPGEGAEPADASRARPAGDGMAGPDELSRRRREVRLFGRRLALPRHPALRISLGSGLVVGGFLGFLPVLGFWMIPLGVAVLAVDLPAARRLWRAMKRSGIALLRRYRGLRG